MPRRAASRPGLARQPAPRHPALRTRRRARPAPGGLPGQRASGPPVGDAARLPPVLTTIETERPRCMPRYWFPESRCRGVLTPLADNYTRLVLAGAEPAVYKSVSKMGRPHVGGHLRICPLTVTTMARRSSRNVNRFPVRSAAEFAPNDAPMFVKASFDFGFRPCSPTTAMS